MMKNKNGAMKYRLALDIGTNSIGWAVLNLENPDVHARIVATGVRIFADGRDPKSNATLKATRRDARSMRRRRDRYIQRRTYLLEELTKHGLFPVDKTVRHELQLLNPLKIRATALTNKIPLHHIGRALFHLNQRRGFKSNRKDKSEEVTSGKISQSFVKLLEQMNLIEIQQESDANEKQTKEEKKAARQKAAQERQEAIARLKNKTDLSFGSFLWERQLNGMSTRARPASDSKLYDVYPTRELLEDEFRKIWAKQTEFYPDILTNDLKEHFFNIIFHQRKLKSPPKGKCTYLSEEDRTYRAMPSFQRYRIFQEVNNLEWRYITNIEKLIDEPKDRDLIIYLLEHPSIKSRPTHRNAAVSFTKMRTELKRREALIDDNCTFTMQTEKRTGFDGNQTTNVMQHEDYVGQEWHNWPLEKQDQFISVILDDQLDDQQVCDKLVDEYGLTKFAAENCTNANFVDGTANISLKAARILTEHMDKDMLIQSDAVIRAAEQNSSFRNPFRSLGDGKILGQLPYYGQCVQGHIIPGSGDLNDDEETRIGMVSNPTVHIAMNQLRLIVNELIRRFGLPDSISIELARDLPAGQEGRSEITRMQSRNQRKNEEYNQKLIEFGQSTNRNNRLLIKLWEEQNNACIFTGKRIGFADLFGGEIEIEHLIPFSKSLDDSNANKVICYRQANRDKGNRTPYEAFSHSSSGYDWEEIHSRVKDLPKSKQWRFDKDAMNRNDSEEDFTARHLNDTRYIGRLAKEYLENICPFNKIDVVTGRLTALLRRYWGLNSVISKIRHESPHNTTKNRDDHRHHAIDAIVVGMTTRSLLQKVSTEANRAEELFDVHELFVRNSNVNPIDPWDGFRADVINSIEAIVVSHKVKRKTSHGKNQRGVTDGQLHNETAHGVIRGSDDKGYSEVVVRWPIEKFESRKHIESIRDENLRKIFLDVFINAGKEGVIDLANARGIRGLRRVERLKVIPIQNNTGKIYKAYQGDSNWGVEIFEYPKGHRKAGRWEGVVISRYDANKANFQPGFTYRPHPAAKLIMRLQINDCIEIQENSRKMIMRLQKMNQSGQLHFVSHNEANVDARNRDKDDLFCYWRKQANVLRQFAGKKVHVSPTGCVNYTK